MSLYTDQTTKLENEIIKIKAKIKKQKDFSFVMTNAKLAGKIEGLKFALKMIKG